MANYNDKQDALNDKSRERIEKSKATSQVTKSDLEILAEKMNQDKPAVQNPVEFVKASLNKTVTALTSESMKERKEALRQGKLMFEFIRSSNLQLGAERKDLMEMWESALEDGRKSTSTLGLIARDLQTGLIKKIPTFGKIFNAVLAESNPIVSASVNLFSELKDYYQESRSSAKDEERDRLANLEDLKKETQEKKKVAQTAEKLADATKDLKTTQETQEKVTEKVAKKERAKPYSKLVPPLEQLQESAKAQNGLLEKILDALTTSPRGDATKPSYTPKMASVPQPEPWIRDADKLDGFVGPLRPKRVFATPESEVEQPQAFVGPMPRPGRLQKKEKVGPQLTRLEKKKTKAKKDSLSMVKATTPDISITTPTQKPDSEMLAMEKEQTKGILSSSSTLDEVKSIAGNLLAEVRKQNAANASGRHDLEKAELRGMPKPTKAKMEAASSKPAKEKGFLESLFTGLAAPIVALFASVGSVFSKLTTGLKALPIVGKITALFGDVAKVFSKIQTFLTPATKILPKFVKFLGPIGVLWQAVESAFDFFEGFTDANKILGKANSDIRDKISAGIGSAVGGFLGIIDIVSGWLGFETNVEGVVKEKLSKILSAVLHPIDTVISLYNEYVKEGKWLEKINDSFKSLMEVPGKMLDTLKDKFTKTFDGIKDTLIPDWLRSDEDKARLEKQKQTDGSVMGGLNGSPGLAVDPSVGILPSVARLTAGAQDVARLEDEREAQKAKAGASTNIAMPVNNNIDNSKTTINNVPLITRNDESHLYMGLGMGINRSSGW